MKLVTINDIKVHPLKTTKENLNKVKGSKLFSSKLESIFIFSPPESGKTTLVVNILEHCCGKNTTVYIFSNTYYNNVDKQYQQFEDWAEKRGIPVLGFTSIYDEETGEDILGGYMKELGDGTKLNEKPNTKMLKEEQQQLQQVHIPVPIKIYIAGDGPAQPLIHQLTQGEEIKEKKPRKESKQAPDRIFLFDDISEDLRSKSVAKLSRQFRHYQSKFIIATQYWKDLSKGARESTNCFIMFKGLPADKLEELRYSKGITVPQKEFERMYQIATEDIRDFFYIDCKRKDFRKNFNQKFILADN
jgi:hypothetical protein